MTTGGLCKVKGNWKIIIERKCSESEKLSVLARALHRFDLESQPLSPEVRNLVEKYRPASLGG
jgi:hypothetical protein